MRLIVILVGWLVLVPLALRGHRWAYFAFVVLGLLYFPARVGFHLTPRACELPVDRHLAVVSLTNYAHMLLFAPFFILSLAQFDGGGGWRFVWAFAATIVMGAPVEVAEGVTGSGHCRLRDLIPDGVGAVLGSLLVLGWNGARGLVARRA